MSRALIADRLRLSWFALRRGLYHVLARLLTHRFAWLPLPGKSERLVIAPQDLRTSDPTRASEIYAGRFAFSGKIVICDGRSPFEMVPPSEEWAEVLLGFGWLRHLRAADTNITRANARSLVDEWITLLGPWNALAWRPELVARRIISWLTHAPVILDDADVRFYRRFLRMLVRQVRFLRLTAATTRAGTPRLQARIALAYAALCMSKQIRHLRRATNRLVQEIESQVLPDGGHITRNPGALIELLLDLMPLSQAYTARNVSPPSALLNAIDRMMPMLRFFRHTDGTFGLFNGMGPTPPDLLATILAYDDARGTPVNNAPYSGYQRIECGASVLLMDSGYPPPIEMSAEAHAGCLSFELSTKLHRIVVNCGLPATGRESWRHVARATAAHSTVVFNETSSCQFLDAGMFRRTFGTSMAGGPSHIVLAREERDKTVTLRTSHDGYADRFGVVHHRTLVLAGDGNRLDGEDLFLPAKGNFLPNDALDEFAVRFHLHPAIRANRLTEGRSVMLMLPNKDVWTFNAHEDEVEIEESVYLGGPDGPRRTVQIVIHGRARKVPRVYWTFIHVPQLLVGSRRGRSQEPDAPV